MDSNLIDALKNGSLKTPAYVFHLEMLQEHVNKMREMTGKRLSLCYAMKANPYLLPALSSAVDHIEVCSPGELELCRHYSVPGKKILFSGVNKTAEDIDTAVSYGCDILTIESCRHLNLIHSVCERRKKAVKVILRLTNGDQFGMDAQQIQSILAQREKYPLLDFYGIHFFSGTQKKNVQKSLDELVMLQGFLTLLQKEVHYAPRLLEYGPGLSVPYFEGEDFSTPYQGLSDLVAEINRISFPCPLTLEMGRYFAASCGSYLTKIDDIKQNHGHPYILVDGGIHHLNYYGQTMAMRVPIIEHLQMHAANSSAFSACPDASDSSDTSVDSASFAGSDASVGSDSLEYSICGSLCTFADVLVRKKLLTDPQVDDILVFQNAGAYSVTEAPFLFLSRTMPSIYTYSSFDGIQCIRSGPESYPINQNDA